MSSQHRPLAKKEIDSHCYRLSKPAQKFNVNVKSSAESYSVKYFREHPEEENDLRKPEEKLKEVDTALGNTELGFEDKVVLLTQEKTLNTLIHGEESAAVFSSLLKLGKLYLDEKLKESAMRHMKRAESIQQLGTEEDRKLFALLYSELLIPKEFRTAEKLLSPFADAEYNDPDLNRRKLLTLARIAKLAQQFTQACTYYEKLMPMYTERTKEKADIYCEYASAQESAGLDGADTYQLAYDLYTSLGHSTDASKIARKLPIPGWYIAPSGAAAGYGVTPTQ